MPGARCTRSLACEIKKHDELVTTGSPELSGIPRAMVLTAYVVLSSVTGLSCHRRLRGLKSLAQPGWAETRLRKNLTPASGRQDHTISPSATTSFVFARCARSPTLADQPCDHLRARRCRVHRIPHPTSVTIAKRPSWRVRDGAKDAGDLGQTPNDLFFGRGLDEPSHVDAFDEI